MDRAAGAATAAVGWNGGINMQRTMILLAAIALVGAASSEAQAGADLYVSGSSTIGEYNASTGAAINASLVSGLSEAFGIAVSGSDLFVSYGSNTIGEYSASTGAAINASLVSGLNGPGGIAVSGLDLYVSYGGNTIGEYNASTGAPINASLVSGLNFPALIAVTNPPSSVPEPASLSLLAAGALGLAAIRRRARR